VPGADDLAEHAVGVDQRLAAVDAVARALVERDLVAVGVLADGDDLGDQHLVLDAGGRGQQFADAAVLGLQRRHLLQARREQQLLLLELAVLALQRLAGVEMFRRGHQVAG
jgi:hypothetical protein